MRFGRGPNPIAVVLLRESVPFFTFRFGVQVLFWHMDQQGGMGGGRKTAVRFIETKVNGRRAL